MSIFGTFTCCTPFLLNLLGNYIQPSPPAVPQPQATWYIGGFWKPWVVRAMGFSAPVGCRSLSRWRCPMIGTRAVATRATRREPSLFSSWSNSNILIHPTIIYKVHSRACILLFKYQSFLGMTQLRDTLGDTLRLGNDAKAMRNIIYHCYKGKTWWSLEETKRKDNPFRFLSRNPKSEGVLGENRISLKPKLLKLWVERASLQITNQKMTVKMIKVI